MVKNGMKRTAVIMAGGSGERFYPLSRTKRPKQLLPLIRHDKMMIEEAIERVAPLIPYEDIYIITSKVLQHTMREMLPAIPPENIIAEPYKRNTAPCLALAASVICAKYAKECTPEQISTAVLTADHYFSDEDVFRKQIDEALTFAEQHASIVTLGITPSRPETGYGYIECGEAVSGDILNVERFREKPNAETAQEFIDAGNYLWNGGMFFYRCDTFINGLIEHEPEVGNKIHEMASLLEHDVHVAIDGSSEVIDDIFNNFPDISIDYGLMERAENVAVLPSKFQWDDVGSWDSLDRTNPHDDNDNVTIGLTTVIDSQQTIVANYSTNSEIMVSAIGLEDMIIVVTDDSIVVCPKDRAQDVKKAVATMRKKGQEKWL